MMHILVTGGSGFIGSNFILHMIHKYPNYKITNIDKLTYAGNPENLRSIEKNSRYSFVQGDICDRNVVDSLMKKVDAVVHFAAESHVDRSILNADEFIRTNILGTYNLIDSAYKNGNKRFHHISTDEVFGALGMSGKFSESTSYDPKSPYSASKAGSDHLVRAYYHTHGLPATISNCSNNYGPYQFPEKLIPLAVTNLIDGQKIPVYGTGSNVRDWIHVQDHVEGIDLILHTGKSGETYLLGGNSELKNIDLVRMILEGFGLGEEMISYVQDRKGHDFRYAIDATKIGQELGWHPRFEVKEGLAQTIKWYKENEGWWRPLKNKAIRNITQKQ